GPIELSQVIQAGRHFRVDGSQCFLQNRNRTLIEWASLFILPFGPISSARLFRLEATSGCSGPLTRSRTDSALTYSGSALAYFPSDRYNSARLFRLCASLG